jgi:uroporphyrin-III C-methyltransferase
VTSSTPSTVALVGAGPGDPGLITVRGLELLRSCDVLVHDRLVSPELLDEAPRSAIRIPHEGHGQEEVNRLLVGCGKAGLAVVRLKGGDPFLFGRGGEEALALAAAGVPFEVVPGVSSLSSVPAAAGIPVTHRGVSAQLTVVTGHRCDGSQLDLELLARTPGTLVLFMALANLETIAAQLVTHGKSPDTPAAVISKGTLPDQDTAVATLAEIAEVSEDLASPALVVIGDVVSLSEQLSRRSARLVAA